MERIPASDVLAISHVHDEHEIERRLGEGQDHHRSLVLRRIAFNPTVCALLWKALQGKKNGWQKVELRNVDGDVNAAINVCMAFNVMEEFQLVINNTILLSPAWFAMGVGMRLNSKLKCLRITTTLTGQGIAELGRGLKADSTGLETLDLSWSTFEGEDSVRELASALSENSGLKNVTLMGCSLQDHYVAQLVDSLQHHSTLTHLDLNGNKSGHLSSVSISTLLQSSQTIAKLDMSFQAIEEPLDVEVLANALRLNSSLKVLDLSSCCIGDESVSVLGHVLCESNRTLTELLLARNRITDKGICDLSEMLPYMPNLRRLSLWGNPFEEKGANVLARGLESQCICLRWLDCSLARLYFSETVPGM